MSHTRKLIIDEIERLNRKIYNFQADLEDWRDAEEAEQIAERIKQLVDNVHELEQDLRKLKTPEELKYEDDWRREQAQEAGMLHGIDAYNEVMGY